MSLSIATLGGAFGVALTLGLSQLAHAQADFLTAPKVACTPDQMTECSAEGKCESKPATAKDKSEILVLDFATKKAGIRAGGETKSFGNIVDDTTSGDTRSFSVSEGSNSMKATLSRAGKLTLFLDGQKNRAEATCVAES